MRTTSEELEEDEKHKKQRGKDKRFDSSVTLCADLNLIREVGGFSCCCCPPSITVCVWPRWATIKSSAAIKCSFRQIYLIYENSCQKAIIVRLADKARTRNLLLHAVGGANGRLMNTDGDPFN